MLYDSAKFADTNFTVAAFSARWVEVEAQPVPAGIPPGASDKLPAVHTLNGNTRIVRNYYKKLDAYPFPRKFLCAAAMRRMPSVRVSGS